MIVFDIETVPLQSSLAQPYPRAQRDPPGNYKSDDAIGRWRVTDEAAWTESRGKECSLNPRLGRIVAIAYAGAVHTVDLAQTEADESTVLTTFWALLREAKLLAGWNSHGFDLPFLLTRSALCGVVPGLDVAPYLRRYSYVPHFDVKAALLQWDVRKSGEGLSEWATAFALPSGKSGHGSEVAGMVVRDEWTALAEYAQQDADLTFALASRCAPFFGVGA